MASTKKKIYQKEGVVADMIVSSGTKVPSRHAQRIAECLRSADLGEVRLYPWDIHKLGATTNVTGKALRTMGCQGFVHIEMSAKPRRRLTQESDAIKKLASCLTG
ncbi:MAG: hypothetical protein HQL64_02320 [Magnetococcales bacterium]|nr:hypothetical protein [Magnetococcales bacterium]